MKVTKRGQVTIPVEIRRRLGLEPRSEVDLENVGDVVYVRKARKRCTGQRIVSRLRGRGDVDMTTDEILALMRS